MVRSGLREQFLIARLYATHKEEVGLQQYESEYKRWVDLVASLFVSVSSVAEVNIEAAVRMLVSLDLLNVELCANLSENEEEYTVFLDILVDFGFTEDEAIKARQAVIDVSMKLAAEWDHKIQHYLRDWGNRMLEDMVSKFPMNGLSENESRYAFSRWLQIASNMPILLPHEVLVDFAKDQGISLEDLIMAADELDLNVAFLDEVVISETNSLNEE